MQTISHPSKIKVYFILVLTTLFWGGSFLFTKIGLSEIPPPHFATFRFILATAVMLLLSSGRLKRLDAGTFKRGMTVGAALGGTNLVFVYGLSGTSISRAGILNNLFVLFIPIISKLFWKERIGGANLAGIALAAAGITLLAGGGAGFSRGDMISTFCALCIAIHILSVSKVIRSQDDVYLVSLVQFATVAVMGGVVSGFTANYDYSVSLRGILSVVYCAVFPTAVCFTLQNAYQRYTTATRAGLVYTLDPVWSLLAGFFVLGERLSPREWWGCGILFAAALTPLLVKLVLELRKTDVS